MATAVKAQISVPGCSQPKPPVPPKPLHDTSEQKQHGESIKKKSHISSPKEAPPPPPTTAPPAHLTQAVALAEEAKARNAEAAPSTSGVEPEPGPSTSKAEDAKSDKGDAKVKRSQSVEGGKGYVLKPLRLHHSFQESKKEKSRKPSVTKRSSATKETEEPSKSSSFCNLLCGPLASFVVKKKAEGANLIEKGSRRLFGKGPPTKKKRPAPQPPGGSAGVESRPSVPPRLVLKRILAGIEDGKGAGVWHKLENVKYIDEEVSTEDSTDYTDVDWGQAIHCAPGEESIIYYTYLDEGPNERVIFYQRIPREEALSSSEDEEPVTNHVAKMENMDIEDFERPEVNGVSLENDVEKPVVNGELSKEDVSRDESKGESSGQVSKRDTPEDVDASPPELDMSNESELERELVREIEEALRAKGPADRVESPEQNGVPQEDVVRLVKLPESQKVSSPPHDLKTIEEKEEAVKKPKPPRPPSPKPAKVKTSRSLSPFALCAGKRSRSPSPIVELEIVETIEVVKPVKPKKPEKAPEVAAAAEKPEAKKLQEKRRLWDRKIVDAKPVERPAPHVKLVERPAPQAKPAEKNVPEYAYVQKPPSIQSAEATPKAEPYYDLDVAPKGPQPKTTPKRPPTMQSSTPPSSMQTPTPPPRLPPPPVPPKTYMKILFPPQPPKEAPKAAEESIPEIILSDAEEDQKVEEEILKAMISPVESVGSPEPSIFRVPSPKLEDEEIMQVVISSTEVTVVEDVIVQAIPVEEAPAAEPELASEKAAVNTTVESEGSVPLREHSIPLSMTSESGFLSSPTPPPRTRKKRFRSMEGSSTRGAAPEDFNLPIVRRSKSLSDADSSRPTSATPKSTTLTREKSTMTRPQRPPRPTVKPKPKPERPPKPGPTTLKQMAQSPARSESDAVSIVSSNNGSPLLTRMGARPLPPPPAPPRHRHPSKTAETPSQEGKPKDAPVAIASLASSFPLEFLARLSEIEAGRLNLTELNVRKINVQEMDAAEIKVGSLQVGVVTPLALLVKGKDKDGDSDGSGKGKKAKEKSDDERKDGDNGSGELDSDSQPPEWWEDAKAPEDSQQLSEGGEPLTGENPPKKPQVMDRLITTPVAVPGGIGGSVFYTGDEQPKEQSPTSSLKSASSGSGKGKKKREPQTSWYDEGDVPGQSGDIDTSDGRAEGGLDSPLPVNKSDNPPAVTDSDLEGNAQTKKQLASLFSFGGGRSGERKKSGRVPRGSLQLYPREESPSSSSATDPEHDDSMGTSGKPHHHRQSAHRTRSLSLGHSSHSPSLEPKPVPQPQQQPPLMMLDPNANYCIDMEPPGCPGNGHCGTPEAPEAPGHDSASTVEESDKNDSEPVRIREPQDPGKRLSALSLPTSEDSWYNCTSGDESDGETSSSFMTAQSCLDDNASISSDASENRRTKKYLIARELMTSERVFVDTLKLLNEDFRNAAQQSKSIPAAVLDQILMYLPQLQNLNQDLLRDLKERIENWDQLDQIADVVTRKGPFLKLYSSYIKDFETLTAALDDACRKYPAFAQVVKDFEMSDRCNRLAIKHYMLKPVQRIPQYKLLLQDYLKHLDPESVEYQETVAALTIVSDVANHANQTMKQGDNFAKLLQLQNSISGGALEIIRPGRLFLREGELSKLSRKVMQPRWFILFNDCLLHTDVVQQGSYRLHHELPLSGMKVTVPTNEEYLNEFSVISSTRSFTLSASSPQERDEWISALSNAIKANAHRRGTFVAAVDKHRAVPDEVSDSALGKQAPVWIPDSRVTMCQLCICTFTVTFRRHHCRACGKVVCSSCSANRAPLQYLKYQSVRVCDQCFFKLAEAFDNTATESDGSTECAESVDGAGSDSSLSRANLRAQFKRYAGGIRNKMERRLPRVLKEVGANHQSAAISGYLNKRAKKTWKRLWFVINDKVLYTYKASEDVAALESIPLLGFQLQPCTELFENSDQKLGFQLYHPSHHPLMFYAENEAVAEKWKKAMHAATMLE